MSKKARSNLVYDVGMHKGEDTDFYLRKGFDVIGFEANPDLASHCRRRFSTEILEGKLVIVEGAIVEPHSGSAGIRTVKFHRNKDSTQWGTVAGDWANRNEMLGASSEIIEVSTIDFADCLRRFGIPHYLKIDIEGMDSVCLKALAPFPQKPDYISIESEKVSFERLRTEQELFGKLGYTGFKAVQQNGVPNQKEPNPSKENRYVGHKFQEGASGLFGEDLPGTWKNQQQILDEYRFIFLQYRLFGDFGKLKRNFFGRAARRILSVILRKPIPGWYDTHARHSSIVD